MNKIMYIEEMQEKRMRKSFPCLTEFHLNRGGQIPRIPNRILVIGSQCGMKQQQDLTYN